MGTSPVRSSRGEALDFLTPLTVVAAALAVFLELRKPAESEGSKSSLRSRSSFTVFVLGLILYVEGHGLHLSANAVNAIEGQTVPLTLPAAVVMALLCLWVYGRGRSAAGIMRRPFSS